jgi:large subunit ribosomal protein L5
MVTIQEFKKTHMPKLQADLGLKNVHQTPQVDKVIVAIGIGSLSTRKSQKDFSELQNNLAKITGQYPRMILSKQSISNFKLREGLPVMLQVTLRKGMAYDFLWRLTTLVLPRVRDFSGLSSRNFDKQANYNLGLPNYNIFPELTVEDVTIPSGIQITIVPTTDNKDHAKALLKSIGFIFKD